MTTRTALLVALLVGGAHAQDLQTLKPMPGVGTFVQLEGLRLVGHRLLAPGVWVHYGHDPVVRRDTQAGISEVMVAHQTSFDLQLAAGLFNQYEFSMTLPLAQLSGPGLERLGEEGTTFGDIRGTVRARLLGESAESGLILSTHVTAPTGDPDRYFGSQGWTFSPTIAAGFNDFGVQVVLNSGFRLRTATDRISNIALDHELTWGAGLSTELGTWYVSAFTEFNGSVALGDVIDDTVTAPVEGLLGLRFDTRFGGLITIGGGLGINPDRGVPLARGLIGFRYRKPPPRIDDIDPTRLFGAPDEDADDDGFNDRDDVCPDKPEDKDGFEDDDGCPDLDNDQDGIPDRLDRCPLKPETVNGIDDGDGCPEIADADKDGVPDDQDRCPMGLEDMDGFRDDDGCADPDNDGDGVRDDQDACRDVPGDGKDGCPTSG